MKSLKMYARSLVTLLLLLNCPGILAQTDDHSFAFEGTLTDAGSPADGSFDFNFALYDDPNQGQGNQVGQTVSVTGIQVANGKFNVTLDFGDVFDGRSFWVATEVKGPDDDRITRLSPRQRLMPVPYALRSLATTIPTGIIVMWSGPIANIPEGWVLCDGNNNTPDLRDRFIVGAGNTYAIGNTGGENFHTLTVNEMPSHNHGTGVPDPSRRAADGVGNAKCINGNTSHTGGGQPHENRPPYYALAYIMKK